MTQQPELNFGEFSPDAEQVGRPEPVEQVEPAAPSGVPSAPVRSRSRAGSRRSFRRGGWQGMKQLSLADAELQNLEQRVRDVIREAAPEVPAVETSRVDTPNPDTPNLEPAAFEPVEDGKVPAELLEPLQPEAPRPVKAAARVAQPEPAVIPWRAPEAQVSKSVAPALAVPVEEPGSAMSSDTWFWGAIGALLVMAFFVV